MCLSPLAIHAETCLELWFLVCMPLVHGFLYTVVYLRCYLQLWFLVGILLLLC